ncbi:MAG: tRNA (adenosine(37)-N6)-dimethylallyltransferase MiaA [Bacillota bacterium]
MVQENNINKIIVIAGPTASGKSALAVEVAKKTSGEVISADSMQIYKTLDIGTAKVTTEEMDGIPHHLIDVCEVDSEFSVSDFVEKASEKIIEITKRGNTPIICGGTGLYIDSLLFKRSFGGTAKSEQLREEYKQILQEKGNQYLYDMLASVDKETADKFHINDVPRIIRALEIYHLTGVKKSEMKEEKIPRYNFSAFYIDAEREVLYQRINSRVDKMVGEGLFEEFDSVFEKYPNCEEFSSMKAIGYREIFNLKKSIWTKEETIEKIKQFSRNYAKRQFTWFKNAGVCTAIPKELSISEKVDFVIQNYKNEQ